MNFRVKTILWVLLLTFVVIAGRYGAPFYFGHIRELSGSGYASIYKMISENPSDKVLSDQVAKDLQLGYLSMSDFHNLLDLYNLKYGGFEGVPIIVGAENSYPKDQYKQLLVALISGERSR